MPGPATTAATSPAEGTLVYDGDCGICTEWVDYWRELTAGRFRFRPYQEAAAEFPDISVGEFRRAIQFIEADGAVSSGAAATFRLYRGIAPWSWLEGACRRVPGFAGASEAAYGFFSHHRGLLGFLTHAARGRNFRPARYTLLTGVFLRLLGLVYVAAFASFAVQAAGLIGSDGILPLQGFLDAATERYGRGAWLLAPTLFWFHAADGFLIAACATGALAGLLIVFNIATRFALVTSYLLHLSLVVAGQRFMQFQWDMLLLEAGFLAIFLPWGSRVVVWLYRWLVFRFMFLSGMVKLLSGDRHWDSLTALEYHFETQPLPTIASWYAHHLPDGVLMAATAATLIVELLLPFLIFTARRPRMFAAWSFIVLQLAIIATGNYNWFNLLTIALCLFLFDDAALRSCVPARWRDRLDPITGPVPGTAATWIAALLAAVVIAASTESLYRVVTRDRDAPRWSAVRLVAPCRCVNTYGPFAVMTTTRHEIVIEGSNDGRQWRQYGFRYKPEATDEIAGWIIPHQPRLDWQMWFAALTTADRQPWFRNLLARLLSGSAPVLDLFRHNPFPDGAPRMIRARMYRYEFTTPSERDRTGEWWKRRFVGEYYPAVRLSANQKRQE